MCFCPRVAARSICACNSALKCSDETICCRPFQIHYHGPAALRAFLSSLNDPTLRNAMIDTAVPKMLERDGPKNHQLASPLDYRRTDLHLSFGRDHRLR